MGCSTIDKNPSQKDDLASVTVTAIPPTPIAVPPTPTMPADWDLILFSDSSGRDVALKYASHIETDLDVVVNVRDMTTNELSIGQVLDRLEKHQTLKESTDKRTWIDYIAEAEVIVIYANPEDSVSETNPGD